MRTSPRSAKLPEPPGHGLWAELIGPVARKQLFVAVGPSLAVTPLSLAFFAFPFSAPCPFLFLLSHDALDRLVAFWVGEASEWYYKARKLLLNLNLTIRVNI